MRKRLFKVMFEEPGKFIIVYVMAYTAPDAIDAVSPPLRRKSYAYVANKFEVKAFMANIPIEQNVAIPFNAARPILDTNGYELD